MSVADTTGLLTRLAGLHDAMLRQGTAQIEDLAHKIAAGEPIVLGPATQYVCPTCHFRHPDTEFANGITFRSDTTVPMADHIQRLHVAHQALLDENQALRERLLRIKRKAGVNRISKGKLTGRARSRGRSASRKKAGK